MSSNSRRVLLTGATGYVGGRLLPELLAAGYGVRCLVRNPQGLPAGETIEVVQGNATDPAAVRRSMVGMKAAYYMIHSMGGAKDFEAMDREAATLFGREAARAGVERIVYLGGLAQDAPDLSPHLRSRLEVGKILRDSGVSTIELRASIVLGAGSLSFEMIRSLVDRLPVMITPKWVSVEAQPIAIRDLLEYLLESLTIPPRSQVFEIGGADRASYGYLMREYGRQRGLKRVMIPVPVLTPWLSSHWLGLVTPLYAQVGKKLIESIEHPTVVHDTSALQVFSVRPLGVREAIAEAINDTAG